MRRSLKTLNFVFEIVIVSFNFFFAYSILKHFNLFYHFDLISGQEMVKAPQPLELYWNAFWVAVPLWVLLLGWRGGYQDLNVQSYRKAIAQFLSKGLAFLFLFSSLSFLLKFDFLSRTFILIYTGSSALFLILNRMMVLYVAKEARKRGRDVRHILLAGTGRRAQEFISHIAKHTEWGYRLVGLLDRDPAFKGESIAGYPVLGVLEDLPELLEKEVVDEMVFVTPRNWLNDVRKCVLYCEAVGVPATVSTDLFELEVASSIPKKLEGKTYLTVETRFPHDGELLVKRIFDILVSASVLLLSSPILLAAALAVKLTSKGPVFFRQIRSGRNGRKFNLYKFRSMVTDAESRLSELKARNEMSGPVFKITDDPRITKVGKFLRKTSLDEFPQFWNVLKGDMSVVGPRPPLPSEVEQYEPWQRRRLSMKPGITCIWQVTRRDGVNFEEWMEMDLRYIDNWSLWLDLKILFLTGRAVFAGSGK